MSDSNKARCKYWHNCFRKNSVHLATYLHPKDLETATTSSNPTTTPTRVAKTTAAIRSPNNHVTTPESKAVTATSTTRSPKVVPNNHSTTTTPSRAVTTPTRAPKVATTPTRKYQIGSVSVPHITPTRDSARPAKRPGCSGNFVLLGILNFTGVFGFQFHILYYGLICACLQLRWVY